MALRYLIATVWLQVGILVFPWFCATNGYTLEDRLQLQQLITENMGKLADTAKNAEVEALQKKVQLQESKLARLETLEIKVQEQELKVRKLEAIVQQQGELLSTLQNERQTSFELVPSNLKSNGQQSAEKILFPRTCREIRAAQPWLSSGMHWIDPDGQGVGDDPIFVYCNMTKGSTSVLHDSELPMNVGHCADPGCYSRDINYNATLRQIEALAGLSDECHQSISYDCNYSPFELRGIAFAWWNDRHGDPQIFWAGNNPSAHSCHCGIDRNCEDSYATCNCDSAAPIPLTDTGDITAKDLLPVTRLNFGRTHLKSSSGVHTLGRLECSGQLTFSGMPSSCTDLWRIGHSLSGLYSVLTTTVLPFPGTTQVATVYCDFAKLPDDSGFQTLIGFDDVKSSPVYFYVQRNTNFSTLNVPIPFEVERLNVGGAMNLTSGNFTAPRPGNYFFSSSGISIGGRRDFGLYMNGTQVASGIGESKSNSTFSLQSTLHLNVGDKVSLRTFFGSGAVYEDDSHFHFIGWLLQEDFSP